MAEAGSKASEYTLTLTEEERTHLLAILEQLLRDTHVEARRTEQPEYRAQVHHQESVLRGLIAKLRKT